MKGIKPINSQVSKSQAPRRLNLESEAFHVGSALVSPRMSHDATINPNGQKSMRGSPDEFQKSGRTSHMNNNRQTQQSFKSGKKTSRSVKFAQTQRKEADPFQETYTKPWNIVMDEGQEKYYGSVSQYHQPSTMLDHHDYVKRTKFEQLKMTRLEAMCKWKQKDTKGKKKNAYIKGIQKRNNSILKITDKTDIEKLDVYTDRFPILNIRKAFLRAYLNLKELCFQIISTKLFENISLAIIICNSGVMIFDDSAIVDNPNPIFGTFELIFQYLYTVEMVLKILGLGFIFGPNTYLRDEWNILDFIIVMMGYVSMGLEGANNEAEFQDKPGEPVNEGGFNVAGLRTFRVARPLKSISSVKGLKVLITAVLSALPMLKDTILILMFFFVIFSIACTQMFAGKLKNRCMSIQTGQVHDDDMLCNTDKDSCPGGYQCFKYNNNLNYGVTNWDNVVYSFQNIFQFVTLEGWSEIQRDMQIVGNYYMMPLMFMSIVLIGAFFLLNLTLAVINSKFTESQNKQLEQERAEKKEMNQLGGGGNNENDSSQKGINETMSIAQYINARIYAKKMIEFLRMRQEVKRIELERKNNAKIAARQYSQARRQVVDSRPQKGSNKVAVDPFDPTKLSPQNQDSQSLGIAQQQSTITKDGGFQKIDIGSNVIVEDIQAENRDEEQDQDKLEKDIQDFLMKSKIDMQRQGLDARDFRIPRTIDTSQKKDIIQIPTNQNGQTTDGGPTMKGNIVQVKKQQQNTTLYQMNFSKQLAEELDIDNIIPKGDQKDQASNGEHIEIDSMASFQLSLDNLVYEDRSQSALQNNDDVFDGSQTMNGRFKGLNTPNLPEVQNLEQDSGLITSDSDFDLAVQAAGADQIDFGVVAAVPRGGGSIKKDVTKAFKKMLTANHMRTTYNSNSENKQLADGSTMFGGSNGMSESKMMDAVSFDLESKFKKKSKVKNTMRKHYKEDEVEVDYLQNLFDETNADLGLGIDGYKEAPLKASKQDVRALQEFVDTKKPLDPFRDLNPLTHKVEISKDQVYQCESQRDVFAPRQLEKDLNILANSNNFIKRPIVSRKGEFDEDTGHQFVKNKWKPYQQKFVYTYDRESSEEYESLNEDELQAQQQPYFTPTRINYLEQTKQMHTQEMCKRADVLITSTLSINLFPKDKRTMIAHDRITMDQEQYDEYIDERSMFRSILKENTYQSSFNKEKSNTYRTNYARSFLNRANFESKTLNYFKENVMQLNLNKKKLPPKPKEILKAEKIKHEQNTRASQKRGLPKFDMEQAKKLLQGMFHEEDEEDAELSSKMMNLNNQQMQVKSYNELRHQEILAQFEAELHQIFEQEDEEDNHHQDEIPNTLRREFAFPKNLIDNQIDFQAIRNHDASHKKIRPIWSGQDVLGDSLNNDQCEYCINQLSSNRVWPYGVYGYYKKAKFLWRIQVKSENYDNFFTLFVFLNTCTLAMEQYGISEERKSFLELTNKYFTWIFIYEMFAKIGGIGIGKYLADRMNWLDGFIVMTSLFEMLYSLIAGDSGGMKALNTLRLLRTFRVFRILRLLKNLESMQVILSVMAKSYMSFVYITMLMWLFIGIFTLLGMQMYGGYWKDDEDGLPPNHFDSFQYALFTIFQVLTMENWQSVLFVMNKQNKNVKDPYRAAILLIPWIWIGNFILLNLFLAILLDAFLVDEEGLSEEEIEEIKQQKIKKKLEKKKKLQKKQVLMDTNEIKQMRKMPEMSKFYFGQEKGASEEDLEDLDEEQIILIFKEQGLIKKEEHELLNQPLFVGIECASSFFIFPKDSFIRIMAYKMIKYPLWETIVIILIMLSSIKLAYDTFFHENKEQNFRYYFSKNLDTTFNYLFIFEMLMKLIAMGVCMDENSYLRDTWNQMDFFIVTASIFDMALEGQDLESLKVLRMLRTLRPLRFLTHNIGMKLIVNGLIGSVGGISNVMLVVAVVILIFAILFVNIYQGKFFYCSIDTYILHTQTECEFAGGAWELYDHNFDTSLRAWITLYIVASLEGWPDIMVQAAQSTDVDFGPAENKPMGMHLTLFIVVIFFVAFFFLNFFIGVLFMKFQQAQDAEQAGYTEKDMAWMDIQRLILEAKPDYEATNVPKSPFRKKFHDLVTLPTFDAIIMSFIMLNMVQMAFAYDGITEQVQKVVDTSNHFFTAIFLIEAILKGIAFGLSYFDNAWNKFDFFVVSASIADLFLEAFDFSGSGGFLSVAPKVARVMRVLRVTRILRLAGKAQSLQAILQTITFSIPALANVFALLILIYFMLSVLANFQFNQVTGGEALDPDYKNFKNFYSSFVLLFALSTGEDWNKVMFDCSRTPEDGCVEGIDCGKYWFSLIFFMMLVLICSYVMLNLFILVIIQQFEKYYLPEVNMLGMFKDDTGDFMKIWKQLTQDRYRCMKIKENQLTRFFRQLGMVNDTLGFLEEEYDDGELKKQMLKMAIKSDQGYIFFNEMLYRCMRRKYGNMKINKKMQIFELRTQYSIYLMTLKIQNKSNKKQSNDEIFNAIIKKENGVNPFLTVMNFRVSYKTWLKVARASLQGENTQELKSSKNERTVAVDIEVEEFYELTTDEEDGKASGDSDSARSVSSRKRKKKDALHKFQKKMTQRLILHSSTKNLNSSGKVEPLESLRVQNAMRKKRLNNTANQGSAFKFSGFSTPAAKSSSNQTPIRK